MCQQQVEVWDPASSIQKPFIDVEVEAVEITIASLVQRHEAIMLPDDMVISVQCSSSKVKKEWLVRFCQKIQCQKDRSDCERQQAHQEQTSTCPPFLCIQIRSRKCRADVWPIECEEPRPPQE